MTLARTTVHGCLGCQQSGKFVLEYWCLGKSNCQDISTLCGSLISSPFLLFAQHLVFFRLLCCLLGIHNKDLCKTASCICAEVNFGATALKTFICGDQMCRTWRDGQWEEKAHTHTHTHTHTAVSLQIAPSSVCRLTCCDRFVERYTQKHNEPWSEVCVMICERHYLAHDHISYSQKPEIVSVWSLPQRLYWDSKGVGTSLKHYTANNQEFQRFSISAEVFFC